MGEILGKKIEGFEQSSIDPLSVPFKQKGQEQVRQETLQKKKEEEEANAPDEKLAAYLKHKEEKKKEKAKALAEKKRTRGEKRRTKKSNAWEEWRLLAAEESLAKKMRTSKITATQFKKGVEDAIAKEKNKDGGMAMQLDGESESDEPADVVSARKDHLWIKGRRGKGKKK